MPSVSPLPRRPPAAPEAPRPAPALRRRNRPLVVAGVVVLVLFGLGFASFYSQAAERSLALAVAQPVAAGDVVTDADLRDVEVSTGGGVASIPASDRSTIVGRRAAAALSRGSLLVRADLAAGPALSAGEALVPVSLPAGRFPLEIGPGDTVMVIATASVTTPGSTAVDAQSADGSASAPGVLGQARVLSVRPLANDGDGRLVSLVVEKTVAPTVLAAGSVGGVGLILVGEAK